MELFKRKTVGEFNKEIAHGELKKSLKAFDLILLGLGAIIGTGVFVITGAAAANYAGPAIIISFLVSGIICVFAAFAYAELASSVPVSGGTYAYTYVVLGEFAAVVIATFYVMICLFGASAVAAGWSGYTLAILESAGINLPATFTKIPAEGGIINLPAIFITMLISAYLMIGTSNTARLNSILVLIKMLMVFLFIVIAVPYFDITHWSNFVPFGYKGVVVGAATIMVAYTGFNQVANTAEECTNPKRDLPIGIIGSLLGAVVIYVIVSGLLTGIVDFKDLNNAQPMALALRENGNNWGSAIVAAGAVAGMTSVILLLIYSLSRLLYSLSRDGLVPTMFTKVSKKYKTPYYGIIAGGLFISIISGFLSVKTIGQVASFASLIDFFIASICVMLLRIQEPNLKRGFTCPAVYVVASIAALSCLYLAYSLVGEIWHIVVTTLSCGLFVYIVYGFRNSTAREYNKDKIR